MSGKTKLQLILAVMALVGFIVMYVAEFKWFQNYVDAKPMILGSLAFAFAIGLILGFRFSKNRNELEEKMQTWAVCILLPIVLMPLLSSLANRLFAKQKQAVQVQFWEERAYVQNRFGILKGEETTVSGYFVFVVMDGELERFERKISNFQALKQGDWMEIPLRKGLLGADFVDWAD